MVIQNIFNWAVSSCAGVFSWAVDSVQSVGSWGYEAVINSSNYIVNIAK